MPKRKGGQVKQQARVTRRRSFASKGEILRFKELQEAKKEFKKKMAEPPTMRGVSLSVINSHAKKVRRAEAALKRAQEATDRRRND